MESVTHPNIPIQALRAVRFLNGLDKRSYRNLLSHVENEAVSGAAEYPATLDRAFSRAVNYRLEMNATPRVGKPKKSPRALRQLSGFQWKIKIHTI